MSKKLNDSGLAFERIKIKWPEKGIRFTTKELFSLNIDDLGNPILSSVSIQSRINRQLAVGNVIICGIEATKGRPKVQYQIVKDIEPKIKINLDDANTTLPENF